MDKMEKLRDYISFDLEFNEHQDKTHLIQVSAVRFKDGEEVSLFETTETFQKLFSKVFSKSISNSVGKYWISTVFSAFVIGLASWTNCVLEQATKANNIKIDKKILFIK